MVQYYFPNQINESQKQALIEFAKEINLYQLMVFYDIQIIDGEVSWKTKINIEKENNVEFIQKFLNQNYIEICEDKRKKGL